MNFSWRAYSTSSDLARGWGRGHIWERMSPNLEKNTTFSCVVTNSLSSLWSNHVTISHPSVLRERTGSGHPRPVRNWIVSLCGTPRLQVIGGWPKTRPRHTPPLPSLDSLFMTFSDHLSSQLLMLAEVLESPVFFNEACKSCVMCIWGALLAKLSLFLNSICCCV